MMTPAALPCRETVPEAGCCVTMLLLGTLERTVTSERLRPRNLNIASPIRENADLTQLCIALGQNPNFKRHPLANKDLRKVTSEKIGRTAGHSATSERRDSICG